MFVSFCILSYSIQYAINKMIMNEERNSMQGTNKIVMRTDYSKQPEELISEQLIKIVEEQHVQFGQFIKVITHIPNFNPVYQYNIEDRPMEKIEIDRKSKNRKYSNVIQEPIFKFGSKLYLKIPVEQILKRQQGSKRFKSSIKSIQTIKNITLSQNRNIFYQFLRNGQYLKSINNQLQLSDQSSYESIWIIQQIMASQYQIFNIAHNCYLTFKLQNGTDKLVMETSQYAQPESIVQIKRQANTNFCILTPCTIKRQRSFQNIQRQSPNKKLGQSSNENGMQSSMKIQLIAISSSEVNLFYQLKFAQEILKYNPTLARIKQIIQQLIFYSIPQFSYTQGLLSIPIQKLFYQNHISQLILNYLINKINQIGFTKQLATVIQNDIRLLCYGSQQNSQIFKQLITVILQCADYNLFIPSLIKLINKNYYFINSFQSKGWSHIIVSKFKIIHSVNQYKILYELMKLTAQFCLDNYSMANKYYVMHTVQQIFDTNNKQLNGQRNDDFDLWMRLFSEGQYVFVEQIQDSSKYKLDEIQLQSFLNIVDNPQKSEQNRFKYMGQIQMIGAFCSGFNINAINRYYQILKAISAYCYNETYPYFSHYQCKQATMKAISMSFDWSSDEKKLENKYNIGSIFTDNAPSTSTTNLNARLSQARQKSQTKHKLQNFRGFNKKASAFADILKYFFKTFQSCIKDYLIKNQRKQLTLFDIISLKNNKQQSKFGCKLINWIKITNIALSQRLITTMKKKIDPYTQYFKRVFKNRNQSKQKTDSPQKRPKSPKSSISVLALPENDFYYEINLTLQFLVRLMKYTPLYDTYLKQKRVRKDLSNMNKDRIISKMFNFFKQSPNQNFKEKQNYNKLIYMDEKLIDQKQKNELKQVLQVKSQCFDTLSLVYQNIIQQQIQNQVQTLGYMLKNANLFPTKFSLDGASKRFPYTDSAFKLSLYQNWYLISDPQILNKATTCLRYIYDQQQIYLRQICNIFLLFTKQCISFHQHIHVFMSQAQKLAICISTWFEPALLNSHSLYYQNFNMLYNCLQSVNNQIRKLNSSNLLILVDYQQIIQNLGLFQISLCIITHFNHLFKRNTKNSKLKNKAQNQQNRDMKKQISQIEQQLVKMLQFYVHYNEANKNKLFIIMGDALSVSLPTFKLLIFMLRQSNNLQHLVRLMSNEMISNFCKMLPQSKQFLQIMLLLNDFDFIKLTHLFTTQLISNNTSQGSVEKVKYIYSNLQCCILLCKIAFRLLKIGNCGTPFLKWIYDVLIKYHLQKQVSSNNIHFKTQIIQNVKLQSIQFNSCVAYLLYHLYFDEQLKLSQDQKRRKVQLAQFRKYQSQNFEYGHKLMNIQGKKLINNYITTQALVSILQNDPTLIKYYTEYYIFDLLPLLRICDNSFLLQDDKKAIYEKAKQNINLYTGDQSRSSTHTIEMIQNQQNIMKINSLNVINTSANLKIQRKQPFFKERKLKQIQSMLSHKNMVNFHEPRPNYLIPPVKPQTIKQKKHNNLWTQNEKQDEFNKMSTKAMKIWFKARLKLSENRQNYLNRNKWLQDIQKLQYQYQNQQRDRQLVINASDILSKLISILLNNHYINLSTQNQIFLLKCCLIWVKQLMNEKQKRDKKKKKKKQQMKMAKTMLIKKIEINDVLIGLLEQLQRKLNDSHQYKNLVAICYSLKLCQVLVFLSQFIDSNIVTLILQRISLIVPKLVNCYEVHNQLYMQFQATKTLQTWQFMSSWIPLKLISDLTIEIAKNYEIGIHGYSLLCRQFLIARNMLSKTAATNPQIGISDVLDLLKQMSPESVRQYEEKLKITSEFFETLDNLG